MTIVNSITLIFRCHNNKTKKDIEKKKNERKSKKKHNEDECINAFKFLLYDGLYKEPFIHSVRYCLLLDRNLCKCCIEEKRKRERERNRKNDQMETLWIYFVLVCFFI